MNYLLESQTWFMSLAVIVGGIYFFRQPEMESWPTAARCLIAIFCLWTALVLFPGELDPGMISFFGAMVIVLATSLFLLGLLQDVLHTFKEIVTSEKRLAKSLPEYLLEICSSLLSLAKTRTGALVIIERKDGLLGKVDSGLSFDAEVKEEVITALFQKDSPIHDGAMIIRDGRIQKVKGILPLKTKAILPMGTGTRHRAAIGITERTDAIGLVVSEERGEISIAFHGELIRINSKKELMGLLKLAIKGKSISQGEAA